MRGHDKCLDDAYVRNSPLRGKKWPERTMRAISLAFVIMALSWP